LSPACGDLTVDSILPPRYVASNTKTGEAVNLDQRAKGFRFEVQGRSLGQPIDGRSC
jgi:hypothetical protein